jgi:hypothetical protein
MVMTKSLLATEVNMKVEVLRHKDTDEKVIIFHEQIDDICKLNREVDFYVTVNANEIEISLKELELQLRSLFTPVSNDEEIYVKQYEMACKVPENNVHIRSVYLLSIRFVYDKDMGSLTIQFFGVNV